MNMSSIKIAMVWMALALWSAIAHAGTVTYVYTDPQGTPLAEADVAGNITARFDYAPYGVASTANGMTGAPNGPGYTGHVNDPESGFVYMQARYYDPAVGRFLSIDPLAPAVGNPFNFSRYAYASNNPIANVDPDGRQDMAERAEQPPPPPPTITDRLNSFAKQLAYDVATLGGLNRTASVGDYAGATIRTAMLASPFALEGMAERFAAVESTPTISMAEDFSSFQVPEQTADLSSSSPATGITQPYVRPSGTPTAAQRASVQGLPCVDCGLISPVQRADHIVPLVQEYYSTGTIDINAAKSLDAVQPQCVTCSAKQGYQMMKYSMQMKKAAGL